MSPRKSSPTLHAHEEHSPLTSLVRRASSRRQRNKEKELATLHLPNQNPSTPPRHAPAQPEWNSPISPLLHTQFRNSTATTTTYSDGNSYIVDPNRSTMSFTAEGNSRPHSDATIREHSTAFTDYDLDDITARYRDSWRTSGAASRDTQPSRPSNESQILPAVPTVVVSSEPEPSNRGRAPSQLPPERRNANFSRPVPPVIDGTEERKRQVLLRNQNRTPSPFSRPSGDSIRSTRSPSPGGSMTAVPPPPPPITIHSPGGTASSSSPSHVPLKNILVPPHSMPISALQPQPLSPASLYSNYSYYAPERINPSPQSSNFHLTPQPPTPQSSSSRNTPSPTHPATNEHGEITDPQTPQDYLQLGIKHHLANRLKESASCFEKSATLNGGCGVGMLMWGLALRHGWGCEKDEIKGFKWLRRAAELAVGDLEGARGGVDTSAVKSELVLAIYEVGQSFFRGWGVEKDKQMGVSYFRVAARLGDPDAQQELAFCLANGKGCKKDRKEAAKWYREAVAQGASDIGLAWIYKEKFQ